MAENKINILDEINSFEDLTNWIQNVEWDVKELYNKGNQEQYSKLIANAIEKLKLSKDDLLMFLNIVFEKITDENAVIIFFILCLSYQYKYVANMRDFLIDKSYVFVDEYIIDELLMNSNNFNSNNLNRFIEIIFNNLKTKNKNISAQDSFILIISILKLVHNSGNRMYKDKTILNIERELVEFFYKKYNHNSDVKIENYVAGDIMGQQIKDETFVKNLIKYVYLYNGLSEKNELLEIANQNLIEDKNSLSYKIANMNIIIESLNEQLIDKDNQILAINNELSQAHDDRNKAENRLSFEKNKYEQGFLSMQANLLDSLKSDLQLEIEGIENIIELLPDEKKAKILRRLRRIEKVIDERLGG